MRYFLRLEPDTQRFTFMDIMMWCLPLLAVAAVGSYLLFQRYKGESLKTLSKGDFHFLVVIEGGVPVYAYPEFEGDRENIFSFLFAALTSLGDEMWGEKGMTKLEKRGKTILCHKQGEIFYSLLFESNFNERKVREELKRLVSEFNARVGSTSDELQRLTDSTKEQFTQWFEETFFK